MIVGVKCWADAGGAVMVSCDSKVMHRPHGSRTYTCTSSYPIDGHSCSTLPFHISLHLNARALPQKVYRLLPIRHPLTAFTARAVQLYSGHLTPQTEVSGVSDVDRIRAA